MNSHSSKLGDILIYDILLSPWLTPRLCSLPYAQGKSHYRFPSQTCFRAPLLFSFPYLGCRFVELNQLQWSALPLTSPLSRQRRGERESGGSGGGTEAYKYDHKAHGCFHHGPAGHSLSGAGVFRVGIRLIRASRILTNALTTKTLILE